jgi:glutathione peroxidase
MKTFLCAALALLGVIAMGRMVTAEDAAAAGAKPPAATPLDQEMQTLHGKKINLAEKYQGKVVLLVNVASKCGLTPQYEQLEALHDKYADEGLAIVGVPCNQFKNQEPGTAAEIAQFCKSKYGVEFDLLAKVDVNGPEAAPLYKHLTSKETNPQFAGEITWNFEKFLFDRQGQLVARFAPRVKPDAKEVVSAIEAELANKPQQ